MERLTTEADGAPAIADLDRGQEAVYVTADKKVGAWRAPYCGKRTLDLPTFRATAEELDALAKDVAARVPAGTKLRLVRCSPDGEDGAAEWAAWAPVEHSNPMLVGD
jgi:hypothetical protein